MACPCGETKPHEVARRRTADGKTVALWSDGSVTAALGFALAGVGAPRSTYTRRKAVEAGWLVLAEVELYRLAEVPELVKAARRAVVQQILAPVVFLRRTMAGERFRLVNGAVVIASRDPSKDPAHVNRGTGFMDWTIRDGLRIAIYHDRRVTYPR
jgi:hypothetical protein